MEHTQISWPNDSDSPPIKFLDSLAGQWHYNATFKLPHVSSTTSSKRQVINLIKIRTHFVEIIGAICQCFGTTSYISTYHYLHMVRLLVGSNTKFTVAHDIRGYSIMT